ncbi:MAG: hypothetical protein Kow0029_10640 [Candidatus Rifleibacteriota bacterium]
MVTSPDSLNFIGLGSFSCVILDSPALYRDLKKISLGIRDSASSEGLYRIFSGELKIPVYILVDRKSAPTPEMRELGIDYILSSEMGDLVSENSQEISAEIPLSANKVLTADDIRTLHLKGCRTIPSGSALTSWAAEIADALEMKKQPDNFCMLVNLASYGKSKLAEKKSTIFELSSKFSELFYVINPCILPVFSELFPALKSRSVSSTIHWENQGAYTGEVSASMLADIGCYGAVVPAIKPYCTKENLEKLLSQAAKFDLKLFSTFTLAYGTGCDIIARSSNQSGKFIPLYSEEVLKPGNTPEAGALIADIDYFMQMPFRKGNY